MPKIASKRSSSYSSKVHSGNREDDRVATAVKRWDLGADRMYQMMENIFPCPCHSWDYTEILRLDHEDKSLSCAVQHQRTSLHLTSVSYRCLSWWSIAYSPQFFNIFQFSDVNAAKLQQILCGNMDHVDGKNGQPILSTLSLLPFNHALLFSM